MVLDKVQLSDLDNAAYLPNGRYIKGMIAGNENWRSPEAFFKSKLSNPADMFSFGIVVSAPTQDFMPPTNTLSVFMLFLVAWYWDQTPILRSIKSWVHCLIYFGDQEGLDGLKAYLGDDEISLTVLNMLWEDRHEPYIPYKPFSDWHDVEDTAFKDLILGLMNLDPSKRITAQEALEHPWLKDAWY
jgi:serine/threonine protein kinase